MCEWTLPYTGSGSDVGNKSEEIIFASFLEDISSDFLIIASRDESHKVSKIYITKVKKVDRDDSESSSGNSDEDEDDYIKNNKMK